MMEVKRYNSNSIVAVQFAAHEHVGIFKEFGEGPALEMATDVAENLLAQLLRLLNPRAAENAEGEG